MVKQLPDGTAPGRTERSLLRRTAAVALSGTVALGLLAATAGGIVLLQERAAATQPPAARDPLPVAVETIEMQDHHLVAESFAGRLEPKRETAMAFERAGLVTDILVDEGDEVAAGQVIARLDVEPLLARRAELAAERDQRLADRELARLTAERQEALFAQGHASAQRFDEARLAQQSFQAAIARVEAQTRTLDIDIEKSTIRAPFAGRVAERFVDEGRVVDAGTPLVRLLEVGRAQVRIGLSPRAAEPIEVGDAVTLASGERRIPATLAALRPDLAQGTRTIPSLFELSGPPPIPYGELVELVLERRLEVAGAWLPLSALSEGPKGVWVVTTVVDDEEGKAVAGREAVEILHVADGRAFVQGTIRDGMRVVVEGGNRVVPGQAVEPVAPARPAGEPSATIAQLPAG